MEKIELLIETNAKHFEEKVQKFCDNGHIVKWETFRVNDICTETYEATYFYVVLVKI